MTRVLIVTLDPPTGPGGLEGRTMSYTRGLLQRSIQVEVAALSPGQEGSTQPYFGTRLLRLSSSILKLPRTIGLLGRAMGQSSIDSVFMLSGGPALAGILVLSFSKVTGRKSSVFFHGRDVLQARRHPAARIILTLSLLLADGIATNSRYTAGLLPMKSRRPLTVIYPGVDERIAQGFTGIERDQRSPSILFVGRLIRRKGADLLLAAFGQLKSEFPGLRLDIVGDGPESSNLRAISERLGLGKAVTFHGELHGPDLWKMYAGASLLVMPSRQTAYDAEGFGTVFLEAALFGVPSIGTRTGGVPEAVLDGVTGRLIDSEDVRGLKQEIRNLIDDPTELARLGTNARKRALELSWDASTEQLLRALGRIA